MDMLQQAFQVFCEVYPIGVFVWYPISPFRTMFSLLQTIPSIPTARVSLCLSFLVMTQALVCPLNLAPNFFKSSFTWKVGPGRKWRQAVGIRDTDGYRWMQDTKKQLYMNNHHFNELNQLQMGHHSSAVTAPIDLDLLLKKHKKALP